MINAKLMIIGHGEHRGALETMSRGLKVAADIIWAGYHEEGLADHYRAADFLLFTSKGSDEGHRAVIEAMACGTVPITAPLAGMSAILGNHLSASLTASEGSPDSLASTLLSRVDLLDDLRERVVDRATDFTYPRAAERLITIYSTIL
jgi:glycosyltransferase involved in cell wall biosynthesis